MNKIYGYTEPHLKKNGIIKIGQTVENVNEYIKHLIQTRNSSIHKEFEILFEIEATFNDTKEEFSDHYVHKILEKQLGFKRLRDEKSEGTTEEFVISKEEAILVIEAIKNRRTDIQSLLKRPNEFEMRPEQVEAVSLTSKYFKSRIITNENELIPEFLWNAKMRFGKTFTSYKLAEEMEWEKILILTYKPAVEEAWKEDLIKHRNFKGWNFINKETDFKSIELLVENDNKIAWFSSYQDILGNDKEGNIKEKHKELFNMQWDCIIIDEYHYGAHGKLAKSQNADEKCKIEDNNTDDESFDNNELENINLGIEKVKKELKTKFRLYLSGTPFKAIASSEFDEDQIFNWTYTNEQKAKREWNNLYPDKKNPYASLPEINLYAYQLDEQLLNKGIKVGKDSFSLNIFFEASKSKNEEGKEIGVFTNEEAVKIWLDNIRNGRKLTAEEEENQIINGEILEIKNSHYPYADKKLNGKVNHSFWYLPSVASCYAMEDLLKKDEYYNNNYEIIVVAGKKGGGSTEALKTVKRGIENSFKNKKNKSITLSCGKLTTGVSVKEWSAIFFLRNLASAESYFQAAFRVQTPYVIDNKINKEKCYIFDFSPNRSLKLLKEYSVKLSDKTDKDNKEISETDKVSDFINYLPVLMSSKNEMKSVDATDILTFEMTGITSKGLAEYIQSSKHVNLKPNIFENLLSDIEALDIVSRIIQFKTFKPLSEIKEDIGMIVSSNDKLKDLNKKKKEEGSKLNKSDKKEQTLEEKKNKTKKEEIRQALLTLLSRIPLFMYLTDTSEETLQDVIDEKESMLFKRTTGITSQEFMILKNLGIINIDSMDGYIKKFKQIEDKNYEFIKETLFIKN